MSYQWHSIRQGNTDAIRLGLSSKPKIRRRKVEEKEQHKNVILDSMK